MIIAIASNNSTVRNVAARMVAELLKDLKTEVKGVSNLPNYRPNRQLFGGGDDFDNWAVEIDNLEDLKILGKRKPITIFVDYLAALPFTNSNGDNFTFHLHTSLADDLKEELKNILVEQKLMYA